MFQHKYTRLVFSDKIFMICRCTLPVFLFLSSGLHSRASRVSTQYIVRAYCERRGFSARGSHMTMAAILSILVAAGRLLSRRSTGARDRDESVTVLASITIKDHRIDFGKQVLHREAR